MICFFCFTCTLWCLYCPPIFWLIEWLLSSEKLLSCCWSKAQIVVFTVSWILYKRFVHFYFLLITVVSLKFILVLNFTVTSPKIWVTAWYEWFVHRIKKQPFAQSIFRPTFAPQPNLKSVSPLLLSITVGWNL